MRTSKSVKGKESAFTKSYQGNWLQDVYVVTNHQRSLYDGVNYYKLDTWKGDKVHGRFYEPQLQKVRGLPNEWRVTKKLKYRGCGPTRQVLVNWQGLAPDYQTWIPVKELKQFS